MMNTTGQFGQATRGKVTACTGGSLFKVFPSGSSSSTTVRVGQKGPKQ
jgi:hypothetical protein